MEGWREGGCQHMSLRDEGGCHSGTQGNVWQM